MKFLIILCLALIAAWGFNGACAGGSTGKDDLDRFILTGSRQGQSLGFVDVDGDGIDDEIVGAPYAVSSSNTGAMTVGYAGNPDSSPVLSRTIKRQNGTIIHPGGAFWSADGADYRALRQWVSEGAADN